ncbi:MAG: uracil-DNA glycosylase [Gammaproteobacteria bacterium]|nr:uracil-DNA glycosylase [Gammaproteobacteria bacterium]
MHSNKIRGEKIGPAWQKQLTSEWNAPYMQSLNAFLVQERKAGKVIYPPSALIFRALELTPFDQVKVVILGQDPYHGPGQAEGLSFSVPQGMKRPPSLKNIQKELIADLGLQLPNEGSLESWARQGVLLLNSVLSVEQNQAASHRGQGWERFTDAIIAVLNQNREHLVFMLWGNDAQKKGRLIDRTRHLVLESAHPSPFSVRGFLGCKHFSKANAYLREHGMDEMVWGLMSI